jgi:hypothetical protein
MLEEPDAKTQNKKKRPRRISNHARRTRCKNTKQKEKTSTLYQMCSPISLCSRNSYRGEPIPKWKIEKQLYSIADGWDEISNINLGVMLHLKCHKQTVVSKTVSPSFCRPF